MHPTMLAVFTFVLFSCNQTSVKKTDVNQHNGFTNDNSIISQQTGTGNTLDSIAINAKRVTINNVGSIQHSKLTTPDTTFYFPLVNKEKKLGEKGECEAVYNIVLPVSVKESKVYLQYKLLGATDYTQVSRRINEGMILGGLYVKQDSIWHKQEEEITVAELERGENIIRFSAPVGYEGSLLIRDLKLKVVSSREKSKKRIVVNQPESHSYYNEFGYIRGFVEGENLDSVCITINGDVVNSQNGIFEHLAKRPAGIRSNTWEAEIKAQFSDGQTLLSTVSFKGSENYDFITGRMRDNHCSLLTILPETPFLLSTKGAFLRGDSCVKTATELSVSPLRSIDMALVKSNMVNVTGMHDGFRFLPDGMKFEKEVCIALHYDSTRIPKGYRPNDIYTYFYDESDKHWKALQRDSIDLAQQIIYSRTNHFTDYINAVLKVPESSDVTTYVPTSIKDMEAAHPFTGISLISSPSANNKGTAELNYPIIIPSGRLGVQPNLALNYSSEGGNSWLGQGWNIAISSIGIETRWGVPLYDSNKETETYLLDGETLATMDKDQNGNDNLKTPTYRREFESRKTGELRFYRRIEGVFHKVIRHGDSPKNYWWEVTDKEGKKYYYGKSHNSDNFDAQSVLRDGSGNIAKWNLSMIKDTYGNTVLFSYQTNFHNGGRQIYLKNINYTGYKTEKGKYDVDFILSDSTRTDITSSARNGVLEMNVQLLDRIEIKYNSSLLKAYYFCYYHKAKASNFDGKTLLQAVFEADKSLIEKIRSTVLTKNIFHERYYAATGSQYTILSHEFSYYSPLDSDSRFTFSAVQTIESADDNNKYASYNSVIGNAVKALNSGGVGMESLNTSSAFNWNAGGAVTAGFGFAFWLKTISGGGNYSRNGNESSGIVTYIDINGDGYF